MTKSRRGKEMLQATNKDRFRNNRKKAPRIEDIIVTRYNEKTTYDNDGTKKTKRVPQRINITKLVNETKKLIKQDKAIDKVQELKKFFSK